jgi:hypothetical protein
MANGPIQRMVWANSLPEQRLLMGLDHRLVVLVFTHRLAPLLFPGFPSGHFPHGIGQRHQRSIWQENLFVQDLKLKVTHPSCSGGFGVIYF